MNFNIFDVFQFIAIIILVGFQIFPPFASESLFLFASESFDTTPVFFDNFLAVRYDKCSRYILSFPAPDLESAISPRRLSSFCEKQYLKITSWL